jgi:ABC-type Na+ transport system ATPase subunit NatA
MDSDTKYLLLLEKIKPSFLGSLQSFGKIALDVKNTLVNNIVEGGDKEYMLRILYEMTEPAKNSTSFLSIEFIKHYEKYKRRVGVDKDVYDKEYKELLVFRDKYKSERKLKNLLLKDYKNALTILKRLRMTYTLDEEDIRAFNQLSIFIKNIFNYRKC